MCACVHMYVCMYNIISRGVHECAETGPTGFTRSFALGARGSFFLSINHNSLFAHQRGREGGDCPPPPPPYPPPTPSPSPEKQRALRASLKEAASRIEREGSIAAASHAEPRVRRRRRSGKAIRRWLERGGPYLGGRGCA